MLKIIDSVDLKKLEKFGFVEYSTMYFCDFVSVDKDTRIISETDNLGLVYDLIQAGLVEKVEG